MYYTSTLHRAPGLRVAPGSGRSGPERKSTVPFRPYCYQYQYYESASLLLLLLLLSVPLSSWGSGRSPGASPRPEEPRRRQADLPKSREGHLSPARSARRVSARGAWMRLMTEYSGGDAQGHSMADSRPSALLE